MGGGDIYIRGLLPGALWKFPGNLGLFERDSAPHPALPGGERLDIWFLRVGSSLGLVGWAGVGAALFLVGFLSFYRVFLARPPFLAWQLAAPNKFWLCPGGSNFGRASQLLSVFSSESKSFLWSVP